MRRCLPVCVCRSLGDQGNPRHAAPEMSAAPPPPPRPARQKPAVDQLLTVLSRGPSEGKAEGGATARAAFAPDVAAVPADDAQNGG